MNSPNWLAPEEQSAWRGFLRAHGQLSAALSRELLQDAGLSIQDYAVLVALSESPEGRMRPFELGRELAWEKSRLSHHMTRMIERDLVKRETCPTDQRGAFVAITPRGRKAMDAAAPAHVAAVRRYFIDLLTTTELDTLTALSQKVASVLSKTASCDED
jgi:DNA-binding MarR family transcriptional regulator